MELPQQVGNSQEVLFCPFEKFQFIINIARMEFEQYVEYLGVVFPPLLFVFNICFNLLSNVIMKIGFEMTQLRASQFPLVILSQIKINAYDA